MSEKVVRIYKFPFSIEIPSNCCHLSVPLKETLCALLIQQMVVGLTPASECESAYAVCGCVCMCIALTHCPAVCRRLRHLHRPSHRCRLTPTHLPDRPQPCRRAWSDLLANAQNLTRGGRRNEPTNEKCLQSM